MSNSYLIVGEIPPYAFFDSFFEIALTLIDEDLSLSGQNGSSPSVEGLQLRLSLLSDDDSKKDYTADLLDFDFINSALIWRNIPFRRTVRVKNSLATMSTSQNKFLLVFHVITASGLCIASTKAPSTISFIRYKLALKEPETSPMIWFKDQGGRDNCIEMKVLLLDKYDQPVVHYHVPLRLVLVYENRFQVQKQDLLRVATESTLFIDGVNGAFLKFRIEDVSKNHQGQSFRIKILADTTLRPETSDVKPEFSVPIEVRSKRNKRNKTTTDLYSSVAASSSKIQKTTTFESNLAAQNILDSSLISQSLIKEATAVANIPALLKTSNVAGNKSQFQLQHQQQPPPQQQQPNVNDGQFKDSRSAIECVINWAGSVVSGLQIIQWSPIGYEVGPQGAPDLTRPLYTVPNPTKVIGDIMTKYETQVMDALKVLVQTNGSTEDANNTADGYIDNSNGTNSEAAREDGDDDDDSTPTKESNNFNDDLSGYEDLWFSFDAAGL